MLTITATPISPNAIAVSFNNGGDTTRQIRLLRDGVVRADLPAGTASFSDSGLSAQTQYIYSAYFLDVVVTADASSYSGAVGATTPSAPTGGPLTFSQYDPLITPILTAWRDASPSGFWAWGVTSGDFANSGKRDLLFYSHSSQGGVILRRGETLDSWVNITAQLGLTNAQVPNENRPIVVDYDNDGKLDILATGDENTVKNLHNNGTTFTPTAGGVHPLSRDWYIGDFNSDGKPDVARDTCRDYGKTYRQQFLNNGDGTFAYTKTKIDIPADLPQSIKNELLALEADATVPNRYCGPVYWRGDLRGTGREDVIIQYAGSYSDAAHRFGRYLYRNEQGILEDKTSVCGIPPGIVPILPPKDIRGVGRMDIICGYASTAQAGVYRQNVDGTFTLRRVDALPLSSTKDIWPLVYSSNAGYIPELKWIDFNLDGKLDLFVSSLRLREFAVYENQSGDLVRVLKGTHADAEGYEICDINGDGKLDIVTFGGATNSTVDVKFYLNTTVLL